MNNSLKRTALFFILLIPIALIACSRSNYKNINANNTNVNEIDTKKIQVDNSNESITDKESVIEESSEIDMDLDLSSKNEDIYKNILVLGIDARNNEPARADVIMLINIRNDKVNLISIPRDTAIKLANRGRKKINASYAYGGVDLCISSVEKLLDTKIDNYIVFNFKAIEKGVDALGGFTVTIPKTIKIRDPELKKCFTLEKGDIKLNGIQTLEYLRYRSDGKGDIGRIYRQQEFIKDLQNSFLKLENVPLIPKAYLAVKDEIKTDMNVSLMASYFIRGYRLKDNFQYYTLQGYSKMINKVSYYILYRNSIKKIKEVLK